MKTIKNNEKNENKDVLKNEFENINLNDNKDESLEIKNDEKTSEDLKEEKVSTFKIFKSLVKLFSVPLIMLGVTLGIFIFFQVSHSELNSHFIAPTESEIYGQKEDRYILAAYYENDINSIKFIKTLKSLERKTGFGYYLIDIDEYPEVVTYWQIQYLPSYYLVDKNTKEIIYASYGNKPTEALETEMTNVIKYGMPQNDINATQTIKDSDKNDYLSMTLTGVDLKENSENVYEVKFRVENLTDETIEFNTDELKGKYNPFNNESGSDEYKKVDTEIISIEAGKTKEIVVNFELIEGKDFRITIEYAYDGNTYKWNYKLWPTSEE